MSTYNPPDIYSTSVNISSSDFLTLNLSPKTLVSRVAGKIIYPVAIFINYTKGTTGYSTTAPLRVGLNGLGTSWEAASTTITLASTTAQFAPNAGTTVASVLVTVATDTDLVLSSGGPITLGDGTAVITVYYRLL